MRDRLRRLEHEPKRVGHLLHPRFQNARLGHPAECAVDLDRGEPLGVIAQHLFLRQSFWIEAPLPFLVAVSTRADKEVHRSSGSWEGACGRVKGLDARSPTVIPGK